MSSTFSEEMQKLYNNLLLEQHRITFTNMMASFAASAAEVAEIGTPPVLSPAIEMNPNSPSTSSLSLDADIPREEIEADTEIILVKNLVETLKKLNTNLNGLHGKKFGFREVIEMVNSRPPYPASPNVSLGKRSRSSMESSPDTRVYPRAASMTSSSENENSAKKARTDESSGSTSYEGRLEPASQVPTTQTYHIPAEETVKQKPAIEVKAENESKQMKLRVERMANIQRKKPKFNVSDLELSYHSNMARNFPGSELRTQDQQVRRDKNTLAARISRTKNKAFEKLLEQQAVGATADNIAVKRKIACMRIYADSLMKINGFPISNFNEMWESNLEQIADFSTE